MKTSSTRTTPRGPTGNGKARKPRGDVDARTLARVRAVAAIVRARHEDLYDRLAERFWIAFVSGASRGTHSLEVAAERAREQLVSAGTLTEQQGERLKGYLLRDVAHVAGELHKARTAGAPRLDSVRLEAGALASVTAAVQAGSDSLHRLADRPDAPVEFRTGEITGAGRLVCLRCQTAVQFRKTATVPPCPRCGSAVFAKGY